MLFMINVIYERYSPRVVSVWKDIVSLSLLSTITSGSGISISSGTSASSVGWGMIVHVEIQVLAHFH